MPPNTTANTTLINSGCSTNQAGPSTVCRYFEANSR